MPLHPRSSSCQYFKNLSCILRGLLVLALQVHNSVICSWEEKAIRGLKTECPCSPAPSSSFLSRQEGEGTLCLLAKGYFQILRYRTRQLGSEKLGGQGKRIQNCSHNWLLSLQDCALIDLPPLELSLPIPSHSLSLFLILKMAFRSKRSICFHTWEISFKNFCQWTSHKKSLPF